MAVFIPKMKRNSGAEFFFYVWSCRCYCCCCWSCCCCCCDVVVGVDVVVFIFDRNGQTSTSCWFSFKLPSRHCVRLSEVNCLESLRCPEMGQSLVPIMWETICLFCTPHIPYTYRKTGPGKHQETLGWKGGNCSWYVSPLASLFEWFLCCACLSKRLLWTMVLLSLKTVFGIFLCFCFDFTINQKDMLSQKKHKLFTLHLHLF